MSVDTRLLKSLPKEPIRVERHEGAVFITSFSERGMRILAACEPLVAEWLAVQFNAMIEERDSEPEAEKKPVEGMKPDRAYSLCDVRITAHSNGDTTFEDETNKDCLMIPDGERNGVIDIIREWAAENVDRFFREAEKKPVDENEQP